MLHNQIDPTVERLRKKQSILKQKRIQRDKTTSVPPVGVTSWCLNWEALRKFNRSVKNILVYDYDTDEEDSQDQDHNDDNNEENNSSKIKRKTKKSKEKNQKKKSKKNWFQCKQLL